VANEIPKINLDERFVFDVQAAITKVEPKKRTEMKLRMNPGIVLMEPVASEQVTDGGIILNETSSSANVARIADIHPDTSEAYGLRTGMEVVVNPYSIREVVIGTTKRLAIAPGDIMAVIEDDYVVEDGGPARDVQG
jgi:co-chaperonin GroES (HSP10)